MITKVAGSCPGGQTTARIAKPVFVGKIQIALIVRGTAEDRAGAVVHHNEVRDIDRKLPVRIERMERLDPGVEASLFSRLDQLLCGAVALALRDEPRQRGILAPPPRWPADDRARAP